MKVIFSTCYPTFLSDSWGIGDLLLSRFTVKGSILSISWKFCTKVQLHFKGNAPSLAKTAFTVNVAYVGSIASAIRIIRALSICPSF